MTRSTCIQGSTPHTLGTSTPGPMLGDNASLAVWIRQPWMVRTSRGPRERGENVLIRGASPRDFSALAAMHARCTARTLLERYRAGGCPPPAVAIERTLRHTLSFVACTGRGEIVAAAVASRDPLHASNGAALGVLVEDAWQHRGLGRDLVTHLAGSAFVCGYTEVISYTGTSIIAAQRLLTEVGRTYAVLDDVSPHLHTYLSESSSLGLGAVREHLAC